MALSEVVEAGIHQNIRADMICFVLGPKDNGIKDDDKVPKGKRAGIAGGNIGSGEWVRGVNNPRADVGEAGKVVLLGAAVKAAPEGGAEKTMFNRWKKDFSVHCIHYKPTTDHPEVKSFLESLSKASK